MLREAYQVIRQGGNKKEIAGRQKLKIEFGKMQSFV